MRKLAAEIRESMLFHRQRGSRTGRLLGGVCLLGLVPVTAEAQIINTLRGWTDADSGWSGEVEGLVTLASGNTDYFELGLGAAVQLGAGRHRVRLLASETLRWANDEKVAEDFLAHLRHNYEIRPWLSSLFFSQVQYNPFHRLAKRVLFGAGARFDLVRAETWDAALGASYMLELEDLTDDDLGTETEHRASYFVSLVGNISDNLTLDVSGFWQPLLSDFGDARALGAASARVDVVGDLDLIIQIRLLHDSNPPEGVEETDVTLRSGLALEF